jgi:hypothetical protein
VYFTPLDTTLTYTIRGKARKQKECSGTKSVHSISPISTS